MRPQHLLGPDIQAPWVSGALFGENELLVPGYPQPIVGAVEFDDDLARRAEYPRQRNPARTVRRDFIDRGPVPRPLR